MASFSSTPCWLEIMDDFCQKSIVKKTFLILLSGSLLYLFYGIERHESMLLPAVYSVAFASYISLLKSKITVREVLTIGILIRIGLFFDLPNLSEDFYRFIWDGNLISNGIHPFSATPKEVIDSNIAFSGDLELFSQLNSKNYFTIYPPISQFIFWLSAFGRTVLESVTILRAMIFMAELVTLFILRQYFISSEKGASLAIYALNPLVIIELTGNLHFEGIMLLFVLLAITYINKNHTLGTGLSMALGIGSKLIPLMFLPALIKKMSWKKSIQVYTFAAIVLFIITFPLLDEELILGMTDSLYLFFNKFEFNAGLFFLFRETGYLIFGFDIIYIVGPLLSILALLSILWISFFKVQPDSDLTKTFSILLLLQLAFSTIVHPWYIIPLVALAVGSGYVFPIVWSFLIFFTYSGYSVTGYEHPLIIIWLEYALVAYFAVQEIIFNKKFNLTYEG